MLRPRVIAATLLLTLLVPAAVHADGRLAVFVRPDASPLAQTFQRDHLPGILELAGTLGLETEVVEIDDTGAPEQIGITPLIVYQDHRGRSIFQGRFTRLDRLTNFIRTVKVLPQQTEPLTRTDLPVWRAGRATIATPVKVTALEGQRDDGFDDDAFAAEARAALAEGMSRFDLLSSIELGRSDRMFYVDVYPYRDGDRLYLSLALFSQFNCHDPVFRPTDAPVTGTWSDRRAAFVEAGRRFEAAILEQLGRAEFGDGFDVLPATLATRSWDELGLTLPPAPTGRIDVAIDATVPSSWTLEPATPAEPPRVLFAFPAPLDANSGEAQTVTGTVELGADGALGTATGGFQVESSSVTMGESMLDETVHGSLILDVAKYPTSDFALARIETEATSLQYGEVATGIMHGRFRIRDRIVPLSVLSTFEPIIGDDGRPRLVVTGSWEIRLLQPFDIAGPDGPSPANDTLRFRVRFEMAPVSG